MRSTIIIEKRGNHYIATASGRFGGGYSGVTAGDTAEQVAAFAAREMVRYAQSNPEGGDLLAPDEVTNLVPDHLVAIAPTKGGLTTG